ncbi:hypothetical protein BpHYR1_030245 [Brachionus plicatilis]|uniref:Uncharacterized protein n=1 Tax=Brachionus plicatilis TaxID=10195 RepID=A0A3M7RYC5_BRAPC|nr:hypothetical protein BpHYR1_030245 [Brachionus plicatilis]
MELLIKVFDFLEGIVTVLRSTHARNDPLKKLVSAENTTLKILDIEIFFIILNELCLKTLISSIRFKQTNN